MLSRVWLIELNTDCTDGADACWRLKQKQDKNSLWGNSHASSIWWLMSLMLLREWDSRRALETFTIMCLTTLCPQGDKQNKNSYAGCGWWWNELNTDCTDLADARGCGLIRQKQYKNSLWGNSHASSIWWLMSLLLLREWDSRRALEAFTIKRLATLCPQGDKQNKNRSPVYRPQVLGIASL